MSRNVSFDANNLESLESQIDRLNLRINEFVLNNSLNASDSELVSPARESYKRTFDDLDKYLTTEESEFNKAEAFQTNFNQLKMTLEDFRSHEHREAEDLDLNSGMRSSSGLDFRKSDLTIKEISVNELYLLLKQVKNVIKDVEEGDSSEKSIKFAGVSFLFSVAGFHLPAKDSIFDKFLKSSKISVPLESPVSQVFPESHLNCFISNLEKNLKNSFEIFEMREKHLPSTSISSKNSCQSPGLSSALLSNQYKKLKEQQKSWSLLNSHLHFQNLEVQISNNLLSRKYQNVLHKEGELQFRSQELQKLNQQNKEVREQLDLQSKKLKDQEKILERQQRKLENMKNLLKGQIDEIIKPLNSNRPGRPTSSSRMTENSPTLRRIRNRSKNSNLESEIEETLSEISLLELNSSQDDSVQLSNLRTKLSNLRTRKAIEINSATSESISSVYHATPVRVRLSREASPLGSRMVEPSKPPMYKKVCISDKSKEEKIQKVEKVEKPGKVEKFEKVEKIQKVEKVEKFENFGKGFKSDLKTREKILLKNFERLPPTDPHSTQVRKGLEDLESIKSEYKLKIKELQEKIELSDHSMSVAEEETNLLNTRIKKIKDLYGMLEELTD
jgi:hypothetical protein